MNYYKISVRYAKALFLNARENNVLDDVYKDIELIQSLFKEVLQLKFIMESPVVKTSNKLGIIDEVFSDKFNQITLRFLRLIINNKRELHIQNISRNFIDKYKEFKGIKTVTLTTAYKIDEDTKQFLTDKISKYYNKTVELHENVNADIIGGFVLKIEDRQLDSSVTSKLLQLKRKLVSN
jgi:F-type H+-transporting ATPase subunit delta